MHRLSKAAAGDALMANVNRGLANILGQIIHWFAPIVNRLP
jgi:hypothetical protein